MPTYQNISNKTISILEGTVPPNGTIQINRYLINDPYFTLISDSPTITSLSIQSIRSQYEGMTTGILPFLVEAALGYIPGVSVYKKFGYNASVGNTNETIWDYGGIYSYLTTPSTLYLASSNTNDTLLGTGARKVKVTVLDQDYNEQVYTVNLAGHTPVAVPGTNIRIHRMVVVDAGTVAGAAGIITCSEGTFSNGVPDGMVRAQIVNGNNQTKMAVYTVPAGYRAIICDYYSNCGKSGEGYIDSYIRPFGQPNFNIVRAIMLYENSFFYPNNVPFVLEAKTDVEIRARTVATAVPMAAGFDMVLFRV